MRIKSKTIAALGIAIVALSTVRAYAEPLVKPGDRLALVGGTFIERAQIHGFFEAELLARMGEGIEIRNLGWSGDNVEGESRAVFGDIENGYKRLLNDHALARPTVTLLCYGANEAHNGAVALDEFESQLRRLITDLLKQTERLIITSPREYEFLGAPLPSPAVYNKKLQLYSKRQKAIAEDLGLAFIDLAEISPTTKLISGKRLPDADPLTSNGVHLTEYGYWRLADQLVTALGYPDDKLSLEIDVRGVQGEIGAMPIPFQERRIPHLPPPESSPKGVTNVSAGTLSVKGLPRGNYEVSIGEQLVASGNAKALATGVSIKSDYDPGLSKELRFGIVDKNLMFFHRHRPQNETYLFLFRKHEQGNNAVEVEQFEPLIDAAEDHLADLVIPQMRTLTIKHIK